MGQAQVQRFSFADPMGMHYEVSRYLASGFEVMDRTPASVTLIKRKQISVGWLITWLVVGIFTALIPFFIYLIVYATQSDQIIELHLVPERTGHRAQVPLSTPDSSEQVIQAVDTQHGVNGSDVRMSPDRSMWWDGQDWRDATAAAPPQAPRSDDGRNWWDGQQWRLVPAGPDA